MKSGLELLKSRSDKTNIESLTNTLGFDLPVSLNLFLSFYQLGKDGLSNAKRLFEDIQIPITAVEFYDDKLNINLRLSHFYSVKDLIFRWKEDIACSELYMKHEILPIAYTESNLYHIYAKPKDGTIWYINNEDVLMFLSGNIFEFCSSLRETDLLDPDFIGKYVYKTWGDEFWKLK